MRNQSNHVGTPRHPADFTPGQAPRPGVPHVLARVWQRMCQALPAIMVIMLWFVFVYVLPLETLRTSRQTVRAELTHLLQTDRLNVPAVLGTFDRETEQVLLSAAAPYFILGLATLFLIAHLTLLKRRLNASERSIQCLREVVLGLDGPSL